MLKRDFDVWGENLTEFLNAMTELSRKHGIGISFRHELYEMRDGSDTDYDRTYTMTEDGKLEFV